MIYKKISLRAYVKDVLEANGCLVEELPRRLSVIFPDKLTALFGARSRNYTELFFTKADIDKGDISSGSQLVAYGSEMLKNISSLMKKKGMFATVRLEDLYLKKANLQENAMKQFQWVKMKPVWRSKIEVNQQYLLVNFKYRALSDDRKEGVVSTIINEHTLSYPQGMLDALSTYIFQTREDSKNISSSLPMSSIAPHNIVDVLGKATRIAKKRTHSQLTNFIQSMERRKNRDRSRIHEYYRDLQKEVEMYISKRDIKGRELEKQREKIKAIERESRFKQADIDEKYTIRITLKVISALRLIIPVVINRLRILKGKKESEASIIWNPVTKVFDPFVCQGCGKDIFTIFSCDSWHFLCKQCSEHRPRVR